MILPIYTYNEPELRFKSKDIIFPKHTPDKEAFKSIIDQTIKDMFDTMFNANGVGLAMPQIGINKRIIVVNEQISETEIFTGSFINAYILHYSGNKIIMDEGCLSFPGINVSILRPDIVEVEYYDGDWVYHKDKFDGIKSRILQHEIDHLDGTLFIDRLNLDEKMKLFMVLEDIKNKKTKINYPIK